LRVVSLDKDIFGHDDEQNSTLWGIHNSDYNSMINRSIYIKKGLIQEWFELGGRS